jgi:hypothetical protein
MKTIIVIGLAILLSGCAAGCPSGFCPGSPAFTAVANHYDRQDPCQGDYRSSTAERRAVLGRPDNYTRPDWCFASRGKNIRIDRNASPNSYTITRY